MIMNGREYFALNLNKENSENLSVVDENNKNTTNNNYNI
jgi:hypothetical protein